MKPYAVYSKLPPPEDLPAGSVVLNKKDNMLYMTNGASWRRIIPLPEKQTLAYEDPPSQTAWMIARGHPRRHREAPKFPARITATFLDADESYLENKDRFDFPAWCEETRDKS